jgi:hypothetical protein
VVTGLDERRAVVGGVEIAEVLPHHLGFVELHEPLLAEGLRRFHFAFSFVT